MTPELASLAERLQGGSAIRLAEIEAAVSAASLAEREQALVELEQPDWLAAAPLRHALQRARAADAGGAPSADETRAVAGGGAVEWISAPDPAAFDAESAPAHDRIGPYRVCRRLGAGGMGAVFEVEDEQGRRLALKTILTPRGDRLEEARQRFAREAELGARLRHVGIQHVIGGDLEGEQPYLVVELFEGGSLHDRLREGPLPVAEVRQVGQELARALRHAHERGVVHRDLKPDNVLFRADGSVALIDFGLAVSLNPDTLRLTSADMLLGTPQFMSPEQARLGSGDDPAIDLYGLGGVLYVMLCGQPPLDLRGLSSLAEALAVICHQRPRSLRELRPEVPAELESLVARLLAKDPSRRPRLLEVEQILAGRRPRALGLWLACAAGFLLAIGFASLSWTPEPAETGARPGPSAAPSPSPSAGATQAAATPSPTLLPGEGALLEGLREAVGRADWEGALTLAEGLSGSSPREAHFLRAWARYELGRRDELAEGPLSAGEDRWSLLGRTLRDPFALELGARLLELAPDCPYAACRAAAVAARPVDLRAELERSERLLAGPRAGFVPLWLERARLLALRGQDHAAEVCLTRARELSGRADLPGAAFVEGLLALRRGDDARARARLKAAAGLRPGRAHVFLGLAEEGLADYRSARLTWAEGARQASDALRLALSSLPDPTTRRLLRYLGLTDLNVPPSAEANLARLTSWIAPPQLQERARQVIRYAMRGYALRVFRGLFEQVSAELSHDRRWLEFELRILSTRGEWDAAKRVLERLEREAGPSPRLRFERAALVSAESGEPPSEALVAELAACEDPVVANTVRAAQAEDRGEREAAKRFARAALELDPDAPAAAISVLARLASRGAQPFLDQRTQRWLTLTDAGPLSASLAALRYVHGFDRAGVAKLPRERLTDALRTLAYPRTYGPHSELGLLAVRLALRLPEGDPWRANVGPWLWELERAIRRLPPTLRQTRQKRLRLVRGLRALREGGSEAEVRALWEGLRPAKWEREVFAERFGVTFER